MRLFFSLDKLATALQTEIFTVLTHVKKGACMKSVTYIHWDLEGSNPFCIHGHHCDA
jgi:formylmethanofuran dehydrogenase subunit A